MDLDMALALLMYANVNAFPVLLVGESLHFLAPECDKLRRFPGWTSETLQEECLQMLVFRRFSNVDPLIGSNSNVLAKFSLSGNRWLTCLNLMSLSRQLLRWSRSRGSH